MHKMHGAAKIFVFVIAVPALPLLLATWKAHVPLAIVLALVLASARVRRRQLLYFSPAVPIVFLAGLSWLIFANEPTGPVLAEFRLGPVKYVLRTETAEGAATASLRTIIWVLSYMALLTTTSSRDLVAGLDKLRVPNPASRAAAMTLRFWSTMISDTGRVAEAQRARGMDLDAGPWWRSLKQRLVATAMPTLFLMLKRFQTLNFALALRAMGAKGKKTRLYAPPLGMRDAILCGVTVVLLVMLWTLERVILLGRVILGAAG